MIVLFQMTSEENSAEMNGVASEGEENADDATHKKSLELQEQSMGPLKEDLADWIAKTLGKEKKTKTKTKKKKQKQKQKTNVTGNRGFLISADIQENSIIFVENICFD